MIKTEVSLYLTAQIKDICVDGIMIYILDLLWNYPF